MTTQPDKMLAGNMYEPPRPSMVPSADGQIGRDIQAVNEQLLLAGLREQVLREQLNHQLASVTAIITSLGEGVYVLDTAGQCTFVNPAAERILAWTIDELRDKAISVVIPTQPARETTISSIPAPLLDVLRLGTTHRSENALFRHRDGRMIATAYSAAPMQTNGQIVGAVVTFRDMTEVRRLHSLREEYLELISHDLRTPLTAILGRAQLLMRQLAQQGLAKEAHSSKVIVESCFRMKMMINEVLVGHGTDTPRYAQNRSAIDLVEVVQQMIDHTIVPEEHARVTVEAPLTLPVVANVAQIERVVINLITNALKFSSPHKPIIVRVYQDATNAILTVTDNGKGIASADLPHLFKKHYRAAATTDITGSGLGLYSCLLIVEAHGGRIWAESTIGLGSTFTVTLPLPAA